MNTAFLLMVQYRGQVIIPLDRVCEDYFRHLPPEKVPAEANGRRDRLANRLERSQKAARGVHLTDMARDLDTQHQKAKAEN
ncbi:pyocin activator PrtN family protein [Azotobacter armeniacus]